MTRDLFSVWTLLIGFVLGILGMVMFYGQLIGISYPVFAALVLGAVIGSAWFARREVNNRNLWLVVPVLFFAVMVAVRASEWLYFWNVMVSLTLGVALLHYLGLEEPFDLASLFDHVFAVIEAGIRVVFGEALVPLLESRKWFGSREAGEGRYVMGVVRGLVITLPVVGVFALLLGSADAVFSSYLSRIQAVFQFENIDVLFGRALVTVVFTWLVMGAIAYAVMRGWKREQPDVDLVPVDVDVPDETETPEVPPKRGAVLFRMGIIEAGMLLGGVSLLFAAFVGVQAVYLFGGRTNIGIEGLTYAEYARRGFFELVTTAVMAMGLILFADRITVREGKRESGLFRVLAFVVIGLVGVMLLSAARRMALYTNVFDLTQLRLWTSVFMGWLVVLFGFLVAALLRVRPNVFSLGVVVAGIGFFATMNLLNPDALIARTNIERAMREGDELDVCYLSYLSSDATPAIVRAFQQAEDDTDRERLGGLLQSRLEWQESTTDRTTAFALNLGRARERAALAQVTEQVQGYESLAQSGEYYCVRLSSY